MRLKKSKALSLIMALVMAFSLAVPAYAAGGSLWVNGKQYTGSSPVALLTVGETDIDEVEVSSGTYNKTYDAEACKTGATDTLPNGTAYQIYNETSNGYRTVYFKVTNTLSDEISVSVSEKAVTYTVHANSGFYGQNDNRGGGSETCTVTGGGSVDGGKSVTVTFAPNSGQEITKLNIRPNYADASNNLVDITAGSTTISGQKFTITRNGANVSVSFTANRDVYITALTKDETQKYNLSVSTDSHCSTSLKTDEVSQGETRSITLTPNSGYNIDTVAITTNGSSGTISRNASSVTVGGKTYSLSRKIDGSAVLTIPAMSAAVSVYATSANDTYLIQVNSGSNVDSDKEGTNYVTSGDVFTVTFEPDDDDALISLSVTTPSGTYKADEDDNYVVVAGIYNRIYRDSNGNVTVYFNDVSSNMTITAKARDTVHDVEVDASNGIDYDVDDDTIEDNEELTITFTPESDKTIKQIRVTYNGSTYKADPRSKSYITVDGTKWYMSRNSTTGVVTITLREVEYDVEVYASTSASSSSSSGTGSYRISKSLDSHSNLSFTGSNPFDDDDDTTLTVTTDNNYIIKSIKFTMDGKSKTIDPFDGDFTMDGVDVDVSWDTNADVDIYFPYLTGNMTVTVTSERGDEESYGGSTSGSYRITKTQDSHSTVTYTGSNPFDYGDSTTVKVTTDSNYIVDKVTFTMSGKTVTVDPFDTSFVLGGNTYYVSWTTNRSFSVYFYTLTGNLTIKATSERGTEKDYTGTNSGSNITITTNGYHAAYMQGFGNGQFAPGNNMTRAQAVVVLCRIYFGNNSTSYSSYTSSAAYSDAPAYQWYSGYVGYAKNAGLLGPLTRTDGLLHPNQAVTRAEFLALLCNFAGENVYSTSTTSQFSDVPSTHWAVKYINYATNKGWVQGTGNGLFQPDRSVSRAEICVMVNHILGRSATGANAYYTKTFIDVPASYWAYTDIMEATNSHYVSGYQNGVEIWTT